MSINSNGTPSILLEVPTIARGYSARLAQNGPNTKRRRQFRSIVCGVWSRFRDRLRSGPSFQGHRHGACRAWDWFGGRRNALRPADKAWTLCRPGHGPSARGEAARPSRSKWRTQGPTDRRRRPKSPCGQAPSVSRVWRLAPTRHPKGGQSRTRNRIDGPVAHRPTRASAMVPWERLALSAHSRVSGTGWPNLSSSDLRRSAASSAASRRSRIRSLMRSCRSRTRSRNASSRSRIRSKTPPSPYWADARPTPNSRPRLAEKERRAIAGLVDQHDRSGSGRAGLLTNANRKALPVY